MHVIGHSQCRLTGICGSNHRVVIAHITRREMATNLCRQRTAGSFIHVTDADFCAACGEQPGGGCTDASGPAGDQSCFVRHDSYPPSKAVHSGMSTRATQYAFN